LTLCTGQKQKSPRPNQTAAGFGWQHDHDVGNNTGTIPDESRRAKTAQHPSSGRSDCKETASISPRPVNRASNRATGGHVSDKTPSSQSRHGNYRTRIRLLT